MDRTQPSYGEDPGPSLTLTLYLSLSYLSIRVGCMLVHTLQEVINEQSLTRGSDDEEFMRKLMWAEEDRHEFTSVNRMVGFRWFKAPNVVCIEKYRARKQAVGGSTPDDAA